MTVPKFTPGPWRADPNLMRDDGSMFVRRDVPAQPYSNGCGGVARGLDGAVRMQPTPAVVGCGLPQYDALLIADAPALYAELERFANTAAAYMEYHTEKFYGGADGRAPTGLWPAIKSARELLAHARGECASLEGKADPIGGL